MTSVRPAPSAREQLLILVAFLLFPVTATTAWLAVSQFRESVVEESARNSDMARLAAAHYDQFVRDSEVVLQMLSRRPRIRSLDPANCDPMLADMKELRDLYANVATMTRDGRIVCSVLPIPGEKPISVAGAPWYAAVVRQPGLYVTEPFVSRIGGIHVTMLTYPLRDDRGEIVGDIGLLINLARFQEVLSAMALPEGTEITLLSRDGAPLARLPVSDRIGTGDSPGTLTGPATFEPRAVEVTGADGVSRIVGAAGVKRAGWSVLVKTPRDVLLSPAYERVRKVAVVFLLGFLAMAYLTLFAYRRARAWAGTLEAAAKAVERGEQRVRFVPAGPREVRSVINALNTMLDALDTASVQLNRSYEEQRRLAVSLEAERGRLAEAQAVGKMGSWDLDFASGILRWSDETYRIFEMTPSEFGATYEAFLETVHPEDRARVAKANADAIAARLPYEVEHRIHLRDGRIKHVHERGQIFYSDDGRPLRHVGTVLDVTERKLAAELLYYNEERFRQLAENISDVFWVTDADKQSMVYISPAYEKIWGRSCASLYESPMTWVEAIHPDDRDRIAQAAIRQNTGTYDELYRIVQPGGAVRWIHDRAFPIRNEQGEVYRIVGIAEDVTEERGARLRLETSLRRQRALSRRLGEVREAERLHLSAELHDRIGQNLTAIGIELMLVARGLLPGTAQEDVARLENARALVEATTASVRGMMSELRPMALADCGLLAALRAYAEEFRCRVKVSIRVEGTEPQPRLPPDAEIALFRIAQEALINVVKHAPQSEAAILLESGPEAVMLTIADDGPGFDRDELERETRSHWGLEIMEERAESIGALLTVNSARGKGTRVTVKLRRDR